jgi:ribose/xylose/arabinose/galactoside ABC-type transport system permease subunit
MKVSAPYVAENYREYFLSFFKGENTMLEYLRSPVFGIPIGAWMVLVVAILFVLWMFTHKVKYLKG